MYEPTEAQLAGNGQLYSVEDLCRLTVAEFHTAIIERQADHGDIERACHRRIAAIPRLPLPAGGRWWSFPKAGAYPFSD